MKKELLLLFLLVILTFLYLPLSFATTLTAQPTACVTTTFSKTGSIYWSNVAITVTNNCGSPIDLQNSTVTFNSSVNLNTSFWGNFGAVTYPDNALQITSNPITGGYISSLTLHFPEQSWANTKLANKTSIVLQYGAASSGYVDGTGKVYLNTQPTPAQTGEIDLTNTSAKPSAVNQAYASINIVSGSLIINTSQLPWSGSLAVSSLAPGSYTIQPQQITDSNGIIYQGSATPSTVSIKAGDKINSTISYVQIPPSGKINLAVGAIPAALTGYTTNPIVQLTRTDNGSTTSQTTPWAMTTTASQLVNNISYGFSTPVISYNSNTCAPSFSPTTAISNGQTPPTVQLSYTCTQIKQDSIALTVSGLPSSIATVDIVLTPNDGSANVTKTVTVTNGQGSDTVKLTDGVIYKPSANVSGYTPTFNPLSLTAKDSATLSVSFQKQSGGKIIAYVTGWKTPPSAQSLSDAGYTHVLIAFGVFSKTQPGMITSAFSTITKDYIASLHAVGIKVLLSLGGASTSIADTTVSLEDAMGTTPPATFQSTFVASVKSLMSTYGFDGIDIDIEHGFGPGTGTFAQPGGGIGMMVKIINQLYADNPNILITLAPQAANIGATRSFDGTWGNYASLAMSTHNALTWVGVQLYNTGCTLGLDSVCYGNTGTSPDFGVAMAADLLENWPATDASGRATGFDPYTSYLRPDQIVLGYPAPNNTGASDGAPVTSTSVIKQTIACLRTGSTSCVGYKPPKAYPSIGGVFEWEASYDQQNGFKFAKDLKACVKDGNCN